MWLEMSFVLLGFWRRHHLVHVWITTSPTPRLPAPPSLQASLRPRWAPEFWATRGFRGCYKSLGNKSYKPRSQSPWLPAAPPAGLRHFLQCFTSATPPTPLSCQPSASSPGKWLVQKKNTIPDKGSVFSRHCQARGAPVPCAASPWQLYASPGELSGGLRRKGCNQALHCLQMCDLPQNGPETQDVAASGILLILGKERVISRPSESDWLSVAADQRDADVCSHLEEGLQRGPVNLLMRTHGLCRWRG